MWTSYEIFIKFLLSLILRLGYKLSTIYNEITIRTQETREERFCICR